jgi:hypothetical protein
VRLVRPLHQLDRAHRAQGALIDQYRKLPNRVDTIEPGTGGLITCCGFQPKPVSPCYVCGRNCLPVRPFGTDPAFVIEGVLKQVGMASRLSSDLWDRIIIHRGSSGEGFAHLTKHGKEAASRRLSRT